MNAKLVRIGLIGAAVSAVSLCVGTIKAEYRRHKAMAELIDTQIELGITKLDGCVKDARIRVLEEEIQELKSNRKEEES